MRVSLITPTRNREAMLIQRYGDLLAQTHEDWEWLIWDDSPLPCEFFRELEDARVVYLHRPQPMSIGEKRNRLAALGTGEAIAHIDDDNGYGPEYLAVMLDRLHVADVVKLRAWYLYSIPHQTWGYFDPSINARGLLELCGSGHRRWHPKREPDRAMIYGYGFSYVYRRSLWQRARFPRVSSGEDAQTMLYRWIPIGARIRFVDDTTGLMVHILHSNSPEPVFPNVLLPEALVPETLHPFRWCLSATSPYDEEAA